jgi:hypothetical protein
MCTVVGRMHEQNRYEIVEFPLLVSSQMQIDPPTYLLI